MKAEQGLQLADVREAFLKWNKLQYAQLPAILSAEHIKLVSLLPFLLQINNRLMPGYTGNAVPAGIYAYVPDNEALNIAREISNKFHYQQDEVVTYHTIDAVYLQHQLVDKKIKIWIFYRSMLDDQQVNDLSNKVKKIFQWLSSRGFKLSHCLISDNDFRNKPELTWQTDKQLMLDNFYSEIVLLAGKYPLWWLVPLASEHKYVEFTEHIKQSRLVDVDGFIDLGSPAEVKHSDMLVYAISIAQKIKQSAELCLINLLIVNQRSVAWPEYDGVSFRIKKWLVQPDKLPEKQQQKSDPVDILAGVMSDAFSLLPLDSHISLPDRLITKVKNSSTRVNKKLLDAFLGDKLSHETPVHGIDSIIYRLNLFKALSHEISLLFTNVVTHFNRQKASTEIDESLLASARNMQEFLADSSSRIPLYNNSAMEIILSRILLKHEIHAASAESWSLVLEAAEGQEKIIEGFNSLLGLLAWCWLNNVVNLVTQVSIDCPLQQVKQTEARFILEILIQQLSPTVLARLSRISNGESDKNTAPVLSLLFVNFKGVNKSQRLPLTSIDVLLNSSIRSAHLSDHCEQLIIDNRGDVYTRQYSGDAGLLQCLCEWTHHAPLNGETLPQRLNVFGHGTGESTFVAQRVEQIYAQLIDFFYTLKVITGRFMLRFSQDFYVISAENSLLILSAIGSKKAFIEYLEAPVAQFQLSCLERLAYAEEPLREIYQNNKDNVLQVFFRITNLGCQSWVLDEKGSLCKCLVSRTSRESYITHWLYLFRNIRKILKDSFKNSARNKIEKKRYLPTLEIYQLKTNPLGGIDFYVLGADEFSDKKNYFDIQIEITDKNHFDQFNLVCGERRFDFKIHRHNVLKQCVSYLSEQITQQGWQPVYVTDIKVPLKALNILHAEDMQSSHMLKFKRQFESRLNKLLELQT